MFPHTTYPESLHATLVAPCGMDCGVCARQLRSKDTCDGCRTDSATKAKYCSACRIRNCDELAATESGFCFECAKFPCARLRQLDKRYRARYRMSMLQNLTSIRDNGLEGFVASEKVRWMCSSCGGLVCVHKDRCVYCGHARY